MNWNDEAPPRHPPPRQQHGGWFDMTEAIAGLFAVFFVGFAPAVLGLLFGLAALGNAENARELPAWVCFSVVLVTGPLAFWLARVAGHAAGRRFPEWERQDPATAPNEP